MCVSVSRHTSAGAPGGDQIHCIEFSGVGVELQEMVSCLTWVLGIELKSSERATCLLNC